MKRLAVCLTITVLFASPLLGDHLVDFEDMAGDTQPYLVDGYRFEATEMGAIRPTSSLNGQPTSNLAVFPSFGFDDHGIRILRSDGGSFSVLALDLLEPFSLATFPGPATCRVLGTRVDGSIIGTELTIDGIGGAQTYQLNGFHNLASMTIDAVGDFENVALDNLFLADSLILFPQLALGSGFEVLLFATNRGSASWAGGADLNGGDWPIDQQWSLDGSDQTGASSFRIELASNETRLFRLSRKRDVVAGWLEIRPDPGSNPSDLSTSFFYNFLVTVHLEPDSEPVKELVDSVGVAPAQIATAVRFPVQRSPVVNTGIAVRRALRPVTFFLYDQAGNLLQTLTAPFNGALFIDELFFGIDPDFVGSVQVESDAGFYVVVLRQELLPTGAFQLTSIPALTTKR